MSEQPANDPTEEMPGDFRLEIRVNAERFFEDMMPQQMDAIVEDLENWFHARLFNRDEYEITYVRDSF